MILSTPSRFEDEVDFDNAKFVSLVTAFHIEVTNDDIDKWMSYDGPSNEHLSNEDVVDLVKSRRGF